MSDDQVSHFLDGGGAMGSAILMHDWASTPLGPIEGWSAPLKTAVGMMVGSHFPKCIAWGPEMITLYNDAFRPILGDKPEALGCSFKGVWSEAWDDIAPIVAKAYAGEATFIEDFPLVINRYGHEEQVYFTFCYSPIRDETGRVVGMMDTVIETTDTVEAERQARMLNAELAHRIKNTLTIVSAIASQTLRAASSTEEAQAVLSQRLAALGQAHGLLTQSHRSDAPIRSVIETTLAPHRADAAQIAVEGPPLHLSSRHALALALAVHELATNALKYGALSVPDGRVSIAWRAGRPNAGGLFHLSWTESSGPAVTPPLRRGFGSRLIEQALAEDFRGEVTLTYDPQGLRCELVTKMEHLASEDG